MKVKLLRQTRITMHPGEIVEVSPREAAHLIATRSAVPVAVAAKETPAAPAKETATKKRGK